MFYVQLSRQGVLPEIKKNNQTGKTIKTLKKIIAIMHMYATINIKIRNEVHKIKRRISKLKSTVKVHQIFLKVE